jgi:hypothetical protein
MPDSQPEASDSSSSAAAAAARAEPVAATPGDRSTAQPATAQAPRPVQRNTIFSELVQGEDDLPGLVGYALYKQNKRDWLASFFKTHGRDPTDDEVQSYILGERTQRRLSTYRHLAEDMIGKKTTSTERTSGGMTATAGTAQQRISASKGSSLRSSLPGEASSAATSGSRRSATATLMFWIVVLIVLTASGYYYVNYSSLFR